MAYNQDLAARIRHHLKEITTCQEKKMIGGIGYYATALLRPLTRPFDVYYKSMAGWIMVDPGGTSNDTELKEWIRQSVEFASALSPK